MAEISQGIPDAPYSFAPVCAEDFPPGTPLAVSASGPTDFAVDIAKADNTPFIDGICIALARTTGVIGERCLAQFAGILKLSTAQWDLVTGGGGGLDAGPYYVSTTVAGKLTNNKPSMSTDMIAYVGMAISPTEMLIQPSFPQIVP